VIGSQHEIHKLITLITLLNYLLFDKDLNAMNPIRFTTTFSIGILVFACSRPEQKPATDTTANLLNDVSSSLTFHASFDNGPDAEFGSGDLKLYSEGKSPKEVSEGTGDPPLQLDTAGANYKSALRFTKENTHVVFYKAEKNITYSPESFRGTFSFWMSTDPEEIPGQYCDPIQITDKDYSNAAIWVDITKNDSPPDLRMGFFGDQPVWDVKNRKGESEEFFWRLHKVALPPLGKGKWTHVAITWDGVNDSKQGRARLYLNGELQGASGVIREPFTWDVTNTNIRLGTGNFIGLFDDITAFNRALSAEEIRFLYQLKQGAAELHKQ
jgi:hypothetical protein